MLKEKYGGRDLSYSAWHRPDSVKRFVNFLEARVLSMIDLDIELYSEDIFCISQRLTYCFSCRYIADTWKDPKTCDGQKYFLVELLF